MWKESVETKGSTYKNSLENKGSTWEENKENKETTWEKNEETKESTTEQNEVGTLQERTLLEEILKHAMFFFSLNIN